MREITQFPHCDSSILHAPGECEFCDEHPHWQALREGWRINFTGHHDPDKVPCPSEMFRTFETARLWPGNYAEMTPDERYDKVRVDLWQNALEGFQKFYREDRERAELLRQRDVLDRKLRALERRDA